MIKRKVISEDIELIKLAMENAQSKDEFRRLQCVYLGDTKPDMSVKEIGFITLFNESTVKKIHSAFRKMGIESIKDKRGGRYRENITLKQEGELLKQFKEQNEAGKIIEISKVKLEYERQVGKTVHKSVIYRMLDRHGFHEILPYKRYPKVYKEDQEAF